MRKTTIGAGLALALSLGAAASAQTAGGPGGERAAREQGAAHDSIRPRGPRGDRARAGDRQRDRQRGADGFLLRGITLSADQQAKVAELRERQREQFAAERKARTERGTQAPRGERGARQPRDTAAIAARRAEMEKRRDQHVSELRAVLTDAQRDQFDRNVAEMKARAAERGAKRGAKRGA